MEAEVWLQRGEGDEVDAATRTRCAQEAAEAAMRALALDAQNIVALLLLRQATAPGSGSGADLAPGAAISSEDAARLRAYGLYTCVWRRCSPFPRRCLSFTTRPPRSLSSWGCRDGRGVAARRSG